MLGVAALISEDVGSEVTSGALPGAADRYFVPPPVPSGILTSPFPINHFGVCQTG